MNKGQFRVSFSVTLILSSLLTFIPQPLAIASTTPIYDFQAENYNATTGVWTNTGSVSENVTVSKIGGSTNPVKDSEPNSVAFVATNEHQFITTTPLTGPTTNYRGDQEFTLSAWFKMNTISTTGRKIIGFETSSSTAVSGGHDRKLWVGADGLIYFGTYSNSPADTNPANYVIRSSTRVDNNNWQHAVATFAGGVMKLYLNGVEVATKTGASASSYVGYWRVGGYRAAGAWGEAANGTLQSGWFTGSIGQVSIYNAGLSSSEVSTTYTNTKSSYQWLTPTFDTTTPTANGFTVQISNYDGNFTWTGTATASGSVSISNTGLVTVTGVGPSTSSTATITSSRTGYSNRSATVTAQSNAAAADNPAAQATAQAAAQAEAARKAREQQELIDILALIPKIGELTLSLGETTKSLYSTKCVKGKSTTFVKKGAKCPKGFVRKR